MKKTMVAERNKNKFDSIIFDFDGVLADTFPSFLRCANLYLKKAGREKLSSEDAGKLRGMNPVDIFDYLGVSIFRIPIFANFVKAEINKDLDSLEIDSEVRSVLEKLSQLGIKMGIMSSNSEKNIKKFIERNEIDFFEYILAGGTVLKKYKLLEKGIKKFDLDKRKTLKIGDEVRDIEAARKVGIEVAVVVTGYNSEELLKKYKPDYIIRKPKDIISIIK